MRLVDTAGLRKKAKVDDKLERLSVADTRRAIDRSEVVLLLLDATRGLEVQDLKIADATVEEGRVLIIAVNKWDIADNASSLFNGDQGGARGRPVAVEGRAAADRLGQDRQGHRPDPEGRVRAARSLVAAGRRPASSTAGSRRAIEANPPPAPKGKRIKLRYITQVKNRPPSFVVFGNRTDELPDSYRRYLVNALRRDLKLGPVPLRLTFRGSRNPFDAAPSKLDRGK